MNGAEVRTVLAILEARYGPIPDQLWHNSLATINDPAPVEQAAVDWCATYDQAPTVAALLGLIRSDRQREAELEQDTNVHQIIARTRERLRGDAA